jgi:hypothetical protein
MTNRRRLKIELYQRRFRLFETTPDLLVLMYPGGGNEQRQFQLLNQLSEREVLFEARSRALPR